MRRISASHLSLIGIGVLLLIIVRSLAEVFRLQYVNGDGVTLNMK